jgi:hypothetical protein
MSENQMPDVPQEVAQAVMGKLLEKWMDCIKFYAEGVGLEAASSFVRMVNKHTTDEHCKAIHEQLAGMLDFVRKQSEELRKWDAVAHEALEKAGHMHDHNKCEPPAMPPIMNESTTVN